MVLLVDVSEKRRLERELADEERRRGKEMAVMRRILSGGVHLFLRFLRGTDERLARLADRLGAMPGELRRAEIEELFQHAHTVKGEAKGFELEALETVCAEMENSLQQLRESAKLADCASTEAVHRRLMDGIERARDEVASARDALVRASPVGLAVLDQVTVKQSDMDALSERLREVSPLLGPAAPSVNQLFDRLAARPFGECTVQLIERAPAWADQLGKRVAIVVDGADVGVSPDLSRVLGGVLTHLVRNSIAHGIELPSERLDAAKEELGVVRIAVTQGRHSIEVTVADDGRGLNVPALRRKADELGIKVAPGHEWTIIFESGVSTAETVDDISGRGVGMAAVRADLASVGYAIRVESVPGRGATFRLFAEAPSHAAASA